MSTSSAQRSAGRRGRSPRPRLEALEPRSLLATFTVTGLADAGPGSLREAIERANLDPDRDTIDFAPGVTGTIELTTALPDLSTNVVLSGPGATVLTVARSRAEGTLGFRIFAVTVGTEVAISGLTISNGDAGLFGTLSPGVFGREGGGILNLGTMTIADATLSGNSAEIGGGGILNLGTMTIADATLSDNRCSRVIRPTGARSFGGGVSNGGTLTIANSTLVGNRAGAGGGLSNSGTLSIINSTISGNEAIGGGGISGAGGGIHNFGAMEITASTLENNSIDGSSIPPNTASGLFNSGQVVVATSLFDNPQGNIANDLFAQLEPNVVSLGHNLFSDRPGVPIAPTDLVDTDPLLGPLADNGGPTMTHALLPGSPAVDAAVPVAGATTDQRGVPRPQGVAPDIGAFELEEQFIPLPMVAGLGRLGFHARPTRLVLAFNTAMDPLRAEDTANYRLVDPGRDRRLGTADDRAIAIDAATYDEALRSVTLAPRRRLPLGGTYRLTVSGTQPGGLASASGVALDGAGAGQAGSDFEATFGREILVRPGQEARAARVAERRRRGEEHRSDLLRQQRERQAERRSALEARRADRRAAIEASRPA